MRAAYVSFDEPNPNTGSGQVVIHETAALRRANESVTPLGRVHQTTVLTRKDIKGATEYEFNPFHYDYFAARLLPKDVDLLDMHCSPGLAILDSVRPKKYVVSIIAHDLKESIAEHERFYGPGSYGLKHNTDPYLHQCLLKHAENADAILTPSTHSKKWILENIKNDRVVVIPHGIKEAASIAPLPSKFTAGYLGAFGPDKGLLYLLVAWKHFGGGELVFGGNHCEHIKTLAKQVDPQLRDQRYLGWVNEPADFYNQVSVYVQPSVTESWGLEVVEAMSYGRPVIVSSGAGAADAVTDGVDGVIVPPRDPIAIRHKLVWFRDHPEKIVEMGGKARERATAYLWERIEERYVQFYEELLK